MVTTIDIVVTELELPWSQSMVSWPNTLVNHGRTCFVNWHLMVSDHGQPQLNHKHTENHKLTDHERPWSDHEPPWSHVI